MISSWIPEPQVSLSLNLTDTKAAASDFDVDSIVHIWRLAVKNLYDFNEISKTAYKEKINDISDIVQECISQHKSAFVDDRDDMSNNLLFRGTMVVLG